jgi:hypothetical protein
VEASAPLLFVIAMVSTYGPQVGEDAAAFRRCFRRPR